MCIDCERQKALNSQLQTSNFNKMANSNDTPLMKQYYAFKAKYPEAMLLFRVGDFYETYGEDSSV